jgi:hypothetical protein
MTSNHTPGPWYVEAPSKGSSVPIVHGADGSEIASVFSDEGEEGRNANAALIAAAPETAAERDKLRDALGVVINRTTADFTSAEWAQIYAAYRGTGPSEADKLRETNKALLAVAAGSLGYLQALPVTYRPDEQWLAPLIAAIAKARGEG